MHNLKNFIQMLETDIIIVQDKFHCVYLSIQLRQINTKGSVFLETV